MELGKAINETLKAPFGFAKFLGHQMLGGAWGELGAQYGEATGGYEPHPASITFYTTSEEEPEAAAA